MKLALVMVCWSVLLTWACYTISFPQPDRVVIEVYRNVCGPVYETHIPIEYEYGYR